MCMKEFNAQKLFLTNLQHFELGKFSSNAHIDLWVIVHTLLKVCYRHIVDVHDGV